MNSPAVLSLPNLITLSRILAVPLFLLLLYFANPLWAAVFFLLIAATDAIDGLIARRMDQTSDLGKFLDPLADKILVISALIALVEISNLPALPVILIVMRDFAVSALRLKALKENRVIPASLWGKLKTILQIIAVLMLILNLPYALAVLWVAVAATLISGVDYFVRR